MDIDCWRHSDQVASSLDPPRRTLLATSVEKHLWDEPLEDDLSIYTTSTTLISSGVRDITEQNESSDLKGWRFVTTETSAGVHLVEAWKDEHRFVSIRGTDYEEIMNECRQSAVEIAKRIESAPE